MRGSGGGMGCHFPDMEGLGGEGRGPRGVEFWRSAELIGLSTTQVGENTEWLVRPGALPCCSGTVISHSLKAIAVKSTKAQTYEPAIPLLRMCFIDTPPYTPNTQVPG